MRVEFYIKGEDKNTEKKTMDAKERTSGNFDSLKQKRKNHNTSPSGT